MLRRRGKQTVREGEGERERKERKTLKQTKKERLEDRQTWQICLLIKL